MGLLARVAPGTMPVMAVDIDKHVRYWRLEAEEAMGSAELLIANDRWGFGLFLLHMALEKSLKALVVPQTRDVPPRTHDLLRLMRLADLNPPDDVFGVLGEFQAYCLTGRYPDAEPAVMDKTGAQHELARARETYAWLRSRFNG